MAVLSFISKHSAILMIVSSVLGFLLPAASEWLLHGLPYVLFSLMLVTLIGINQAQLIKTLMQPRAWLYALLHTVGATVLLVGCAYVLGARDDLLLAIAIIAATGPLFGAAAIVRSMGFNPLYTMALTIACTLLMPVILLINLKLFQTGEVHLDMVLYVQRMLIFVLGPMLTSALIHHYVSEERLQVVHQHLSKISIVLVMAFPFGLTAGFRRLCDTSPLMGLSMWVLGTVLVMVLFLLAFWLYRRESTEHAVSTAIASSGRNVLLSFAIAAPFVGKQFMPLVGAMQFAIYTMPWLTRKWLAYRKK